MKKILSIVFALWLFSAAGCLAAGSSFQVTGTQFFESQQSGGPTAMVLTAAFVADDTDGSIPNLVISARSWTDGTLSGSLQAGETPIGWYGYRVLIDCNHAGTEPTENSELYVYESGFDLLGGNGVDQVDNTAERLVFFSDGTTNGKQIVTGALTVTVTQEAVATNSATGTIYIVFLSQ